MDIFLILMFLILCWVFYRIKKERKIKKKLINQEMQSIKEYAEALKKIDTEDIIKKIQKDIDRIREFYGINIKKDGFMKKNKISLFHAIEKYGKEEVIKALNEELEKKGE
jgi:hypothetical protein